MRTCRRTLKELGRHFRAFLILFLIFLFSFGTRAYPAEIKFGHEQEIAPGAGQPITELEQKTHDLAIRKGREFYDLRYLDSAVIELREALRIKPDSVEAYDLLGRVLIEMKNWSATIDTYQKLIRLAPNNVEYHKILIQVCEAYDMPIQETNALISLLRIQPENTRAMKRLATLYELRSMPEQMLEAYEKILQIEPENMEIMRMLADRYGKNGKIKEETVLYERMLKLSPGNKEIVHALGKLYKETGQYKKMKQIYAGLLAQSPDDQALLAQLALAYLHDGDAYLDEGMLGSAYRNYKEALGLYPETQGARDRLKFLSRIRSQAQMETEFKSVGINNFDIRRASFFRNLESHDLALGISYLALTVGSISPFSPIPAGSATASIGQFTAKYYPIKHWSLSVDYGGGAVHKGMITWKTQKVNASLDFHGDYVYETPYALIANLRYTGITGKGEVALDKRTHLLGDLTRNHYSDDTIQILYNFGGSYHIVEKPERFFLAVELNASRDMNNQSINPERRFSPADLYSYNYGLTWNHTPRDRFNYQAQVYYSRDNQGINATSWSVSAAYQLSKQMVLSIDYDRGAAPGGARVQGTPSAQDFKTLVALKARF